MTGKLIIVTKALVVEVRLVGERYHGVGDWPPSPFRLFQAMVAGAYGGRWVAEPREHKDGAFKWLERLAPPVVLAPRSVLGRAGSAYVPNNDLDALGGDPRRTADIRVRKETQPRIFLDDAPIVYAWPFAEEDTPSAIEICALAERLHTFGRGIDGAYARGQTSEWDETIDRLRQTGAVFVPSPSVRSREGVRCPVPGSLQSLMVRHTRWSKRLERSPGSASTLFRQPPKARCVVVAYDHGPTRFLFDIRPSEGATSFRALPHVRTVDVATAVRDLAFARLSQAMPDRKAELERVVVGRGTPPPEAAHRVRFLPLPSTGSRHADPSIRRVLVEVPPACPFEPADVMWSVSGQSLAPFRVAAESSRDAILLPAEDDSILRHFGVANPAPTWRSLTPLALPPQGGPVRFGSARASVETAVVNSVLDALRHAGLPHRGTQVRVQREPFSRNGARAETFASGRFGPAALHHVEVTFPRPVEGPLAVGDGRWLGLGVMAPVVTAPASVHTFRLGGGRWTLSETPLMLRAIRRAIMSLAGVAAGPRRQLPVFFTGHEAAGRPVRGEQHGHLFYLAHDGDGDGALDHVAIVAPHLADRSSDGTASVADRRLLARAVHGLRVVRAGRLGVIELSPAGSPPDELFKVSRAWETVTPYRPTRHPKPGDSAEDALIADLEMECSRRRLPKPSVAVIEIIAGPRGGLKCRARLTFGVPVSGPILLGPGSHFGEGLFRSVDG